MKKRTLLYLILTFSFTLYAQNDKDSLLKELDMALDNRAYYISLKEDRIDSLKNQLVHAKDHQTKYIQGKLLFEEYQKYNRDSAIYYVQENLEISRKMKDKSLQYESLLQYAFLLAASGMYVECEETMQRIPIENLEYQNKIYYYSIQEFLYEGLKVYSAPTYYQTYYEKLDSLYTRILSFVPDTTLTYTNFSIRKSYNASLWQEAIQKMEGYLPYLEPVSNQYAMTTYMMSDSYFNLGRDQEYVEYLILSAITDIKTATKEYISLSRLSEWLYLHDDISRAYKYICISLEDANDFNARQRTIQIAKIQPIIEKEYQLKVEKEKERLLFALITISILFVLLIGTFIYIYIQMRALSQIRRSLKTMNTKLLESNTIKEEYIGHFIKLSSDYLNKLDKFRKIVNLKIKVGQIDYLYKITTGNKLIINEQKELYQKFDTAFLQLFPDFVKEFNLLLREEERFHLRKDELLNTELRIFALIRLGIKDSSQIADFTGYTPNTIYTYRTKVRNKAICRENFEEEIMKIGNYKPSR